MADPMIPNSAADTLTKEQYAQRAGVGVDMVRGDSIGNYSIGPITPENLAITKPIDLANVNQTPPYPSSTLPTPDPSILTPTEQENKITKTEADIAGLNSSLVGKSAFQSAQDTAFGVDTARKNITDLSSKLMALKNEASAIPLQLQNEIDKNGTILTSSFNNQQDSRLRTNAIAALGVSSLLAASQGQLANAQALADKAVAQKYDPITEQITALTKNLELIKDDPQTSIQDKNRANAQLEIQKKKAAEIDKAKEDSKAIYDTAIEAAKNGADAITLDKIQNAKTPAEALKLSVVGGFAVPKTALPASAQEYNFAVKGGYKGTYIQYQNEDANRKRSIAAAGIAQDNGLTPKQTQNFLTVTNKYQADPFITNALKGQTAITIADQVLANPKDATNQLKSLYSLVKNLDPDSAVREGEISLAEKTQSYLQTWQTNLTRIGSGQVIAPDTAKALALATKDLAFAWTNTARIREQSYKAQSSGLGIGVAFDEYLNNSKMTHDGITLPQNSSTGGSTYNGITLPH